MKSTKTVSIAATTFSGLLCCFLQTTSAQNYFAGTGAGTGNTGSFVTGIGYYALHSNNSGDNNTANGYASLLSNTTGYFNTANGTSSLFSNTTGYHNTANGTSSLQSNTTGYNNTASGVSSLLSNTTGNGNTANGAFSLQSNTTGYYNTANGVFSLLSNTTGNSNTANGVFSLLSNTTGWSNTANGAFSLQSNTTGYYNTANGVQSLQSNTTGFDNTANGVFSLKLNTTGSRNTAYGVYSLWNNTTGMNNTVSGDSSLIKNIDGSNNVAMGYKAGALRSTYNKCTFLGVNTDALKNNLTNATAIGFGARVDVSNKVRVGNSDVKSIGGQVSWTSFSDERIKTNIKENVPGLAFIKLLRPVTYNFNIAKENQFLDVKDNREANADIDKVIFTGLLAQEVDKAAQKINYNFSGVDNSGNIMGLRYSEFVVPLIKAVQELSKENDSLKIKVQELDELKAKLNLIEQKLGVATQAVSNSTTSLSNAVLFQNAPNPFNNSTTINYSLPATYSSAKIIFTNKQGNVLKQVTLSGAKGNITVDATTLVSGAYQYSLYIDSKLIDTKQMLLVK